MHILTFLIAASLGIIPAPQEVNLKGGQTDPSAVKREVVRIRKRLPEEGYVLKVRPRTVRIIAGSEAGVFYARQTLAQELNIHGAYMRGTVKDSPRFAWRGYMLDESRHFFGEEYVKKTLDAMAYFKLNKFHWHLTDAPGWRIEIKNYPMLTEVGAIGHHTDPEAPAQFYTQDQIRDIVNYAAERHIEIIPEFDMPGHASAANRAYPENSGGGNGFTFNVGREETYAFIEKVFDEFFELFPSSYIHIGGDEVSHGSACWNDNPDIQALMRKEGYTDLKQAEGYFLARVIRMLKEKGKTVICWDDVIDSGLDIDGIAVMWWRHERPDHLTGALDGGTPAILTPRDPLYLDFVQYPGHTQGRHEWKGEFMCDTQEDIYRFPDTNVSEVEMTPGRESNVLGIQGNLWSETVDNGQRAEHMSWPRLCAIAESAWTLPARKDYKDFEERMEYAYKYMDGCGIWYFDPRDPERRPELPMPR